MARSSLLVCVSIALVAIAARPAWSQGAVAGSPYLFVDDFNDRNDDAWTRLDGSDGMAWAPGLWETESGSYQLGNTGVVPPPGQPASLVISYIEGTDELEEFQSGYVRVRMNAATMGSIAQVVMRGDDSELPNDPGFRFYSFFGSTALGTLGIMRSDGVTSIEVLGTLDPAEFAFAPGEDWFIEGGIDGDELSLKAWRSDEAEPLAPQLIVNDSTYVAGVFSVFSAVEQGFAGSARGSVTFDDISFSSEPGKAISINGGGQTYTENFDSMGVDALVLPSGWSGETRVGPSFLTDGLGLKSGFLDIGLDPGTGIVNVGGDASRFHSTAPGERIAVWTDDINGDATIDSADAILDDSADRALGISRSGEVDAGKLTLRLPIVENPLRAFVFDWDLEVWGGDPDGEFRGADGGGFRADLTVSGNSYSNEIVSHSPGESFDNIFDGPIETADSTLIDGNLHSVRANSGEIIEVRPGDGAVGDMVVLEFDADFGDNDLGWISAIDNVRLRALAPGDVDGNGSVDPLDIVELLKGGQFDKGVNGVTWQQGDFNGDDKFDPLDLVAVLTFLGGQFPSTYASEQGNQGDETPDVIVDYTTGEVTVDFAGHTSSSVIIDSAAGVFNGDAPAWDTMGEFRTASATQLSNTMFNGTESGVDSLGNLVKSEFMNDTFDFNADLTVKILVATPDGPVTVDGHVIVIPEPSTWVFLVLGSLTIVPVIRRRC